MKKVEFIFCALISSIALAGLVCSIISILQMLVVLRLDSIFLVSVISAMVNATLAGYFAGRASRKLEELKKQKI